MEQQLGTAQLQAPGAGLPALERWILHGALLFSTYYSSKQQALGAFLREAGLILQLAERLDAAQGARKVLINRVRGMEDSSRYWSAYMVLEHLVTVDTGVAAMIRMLADGRAPTREVRIQDVKPRAEAGPEQIEAFRQAVARYVDAIDALPYLQTQVRHPHPWFGPLDGQGWHVLTAFHHRIHRLQLQRILEGLNS